jgi:hypothetical protein
MEYCNTAVFKSGFATWNIVQYCRCIQEDFCHMKYYIAAVFRKVFATWNIIWPLYSRGFLPHGTLYSAVSRVDLPNGILYYHCIPGVLPHEFCITTILNYHGI